VAQSTLESAATRMAVAFGRATRSSLSSHGICFSAADMPWESGEGFAKCGVGACNTEGPDGRMHAMEELEEKDEGL
jgi:hypothetical protein